MSKTPRFIYQCSKEDKTRIQELIDKHIEIRNEQIVILKRLIEKMKRENEMFLEVKKGHRPLKDLVRSLYVHESIQKLKELERDVRSK